MSNANEHSQTTSRVSIIPQRWITVGMGFLDTLSTLSMRVSLSITITEMTLLHNSTIINEAITEKKNLNNTQLEDIKHSNDIKYDWSEQTQGLILSSFYWGYITTNVFGGMIVQKLGSKRAFGLSILSTSIFTLVTPTFVYWGGSTALIILRVAVGLGEGMSFPAVIDLLAHWIPDNERSKAGAVMFSGSSVGTIFGMFGSGIILHHSETGWPIVFYFYGTIGLISFLLNSAFCYSRPSENPYISENELTYLKKKLSNTQTNLPTVPWRHILKSSAVWALVSGKFSSSWAYVTIVSDMPKYMKSVLKFSASDNGYFSSLPHLAKWICALLTSWLADKVIAEKILSVTVVRKIGCTASMMGPAVFLVAATYVVNDGFVVIVLQSIGLIFIGCAYCSFIINSLDLSPNYASAITGLGNGIAVTAGAIAPYIAGVLTPNQTINEWRTVFWIVMAHSVASTLVYLIYGFGEVQEWNDPAFLDKKKNPNVEHGVELLSLNKP